MTKAANRPNRSENKRTPLGARNRLSFRNLDPDYSYRVINDQDDRLARAQEAGYEHVSSESQLGDLRVAEGTIPGANVAKPVGNGVTGYLMRIKKEWFDEDQAAKEEGRKELERAMEPDKSKGQYGGLSDK